MPTKTPISQTVLCLPLQGLQHDITSMQAPGLYWVHTGSRHAAKDMGLAMLAATEDQTQVLLIGNDDTGKAILDELPTARGPSRLDLWRLKAARTATLFQWLPLDLDRVLQQPPSLLLLSLQVGSGHVPDATALAGMAAWLRARGLLMLVISHGKAPDLDTRLFRLNAHIRGLAMLATRPAGYTYRLSYWCNSIGVFSQLEYALEWQAADLCLTLAAGPAAQLPSSSLDQDQVLAQRLILEGEPMPSPDWHLFDSLEALSDQAMTAYSATLMLAIQHSDDVIPLARWLFQLRKARGCHIKIVIREMRVCLRYADEHLLMGAGTNLIIPFGASLGRVLTMMESVQGQLWPASPYLQIDELLAQYQPPAAEGLVSEAEFMLQLQRLRQGVAGQRLNHVLLRLLPKPGIEIDTALQQCIIKRRGDMICACAGELYLFLYACRANGLERALENLFRLDWHELFARCTLLDTEDFIAHGFSTAGQSSNQENRSLRSRPPATIPPSASPALPQALNPRRMTS